MPLRRTSAVGLTEEVDYGISGAITILGEYLSSCTFTNVSAAHFSGWLKEEINFVIIGESPMHALVFRRCRYAPAAHFNG